jgi:hypothetical protein
MVGRKGKVVLWYRMSCWCGVDVLLSRFIAIVVVFHTDSWQTLRYLRLLQVSLSID